MATRSPRRELGAGEASGQDHSPSSSDRTDASGTRHEVLRLRIVRLRFGDLSGAEVSAESVKEVWYRFQTVESVRMSGDAPSFMFQRRRSSV